MPWTDTRVAESFDFVSELARELESGDVELPSFPEVVVRIRKILNSKDADFELVSKVVSSDAVLASRLLIFANSAYHNPGGQRIDSLDIAIGRLGFEVIRNTAIALALRQMFLAEQYKRIANDIRDIWQRGMQRAAMCHAIAVEARPLNAETAFLCGMLHDIGALYILSKASRHPALAADRQGMLQVTQYWKAKIGKRIVEAWGFGNDVAVTLNAVTAPDLAIEQPSFVDVVAFASIMLGRQPENDAADVADNAFARRLRIYEDAIAPLEQRYTDKLTAIREALIT